MAVGYSVGVSYLLDLKDSKNRTLDPQYNPNEVLKVEQIVKKNPDLEMVLDNEFGYISQVLDYGLDPYYNRNKVLNSKGYAVIQDVVENDDQVIASLERLKLSVLQLKITPVKPKFVLPQYNEAADYLQKFWQYNLDEMKDTIENALYELDSDRIIYGHAFSEKVWKYATDTEFNGKLVINYIKNKKPGVFQFDLDKFANVLSITDLSHNISLPVDKFIYSTWKKRNSDPYGRGLANTLYPLCYAKQQLLKIMLVGAGKWANPSTVIYLPTGGDGELEAAETFANQLQQSSCASIPAGYKVELLEIASRSQNPCIEIINYLNTAIAKTIESTAAATNENINGYGSKADTKEKVKSSKIHELYLIGSDEDLLKEQLVRPLTRLNFDIDKFPISIYPDLKFSPIDEESKNSLVDRLVKYYDMGVLDSDNKKHREFIQSIDELPSDVEEFEDDLTESENEKDDIESNDEVKLFSYDFE